MDATLERKVEELAREIAEDANVPRDRPGSDAASAGAAGNKRAANRRNGRSSKTVQGELGEFAIETPRDRQGTFQPQVIEKYQRRIEGFDEKILKLYAKG